MGFYVVQCLSGLAQASSLFLVAAGLSIIFGVTRIVNFAHGSFYMLGAYIAVSLAERLAAAVTRVLGSGRHSGAGHGAARRRAGDAGAAPALPEPGAVPVARHLRRRADRAGRRAWRSGDRRTCWDRARPGLRASIRILGRPFPDIRAAADRARPAGAGPALAAVPPDPLGNAGAGRHPGPRDGGGAGRQPDAGCSPPSCSSAPCWPGLGGALQIPREAVNLHMDLNIIVEAFVVVVVGGMGSVGGAFLAAVLIGQLQAFGILIFPQITLVIVFLFMAVVLVVRPHGLLGRPQALARGAGHAPEFPLRPATPAGRLAGMALLAAAGAASGGGRRLRAGGSHRNPDPDAVRRQPALHHGAGRHGVVRPCRLFRAGRLWRRSAGEALRGRHAAGAGGGSAAGRCGRRCCSAGSACGCRASISPC